MKKYEIIDNKNMAEVFKNGEIIEVFNTDESLDLLKLIDMGTTETAVKVVGSYSSVIGFAFVRFPEEENRKPELVQIYDFEVVPHIALNPVKYEAQILFEADDKIVKRIIEGISFKDMEEKVQDFRYDDQVKLITIYKRETISIVKDTLK